MEFEPRNLLAREAQFLETDLLFLNHDEHHVKRGELTPEEEAARELDARLRRETERADADSAEREQCTLVTAVGGDIFERCGSV